MRNTMVMQLCWGFGTLVAKLCPTRVREIFDSRGCQGLKGTRGSLLRVASCLEVGPDTHVGYVDCLWHF